jgi:hypothetical protein
MPSLLAEKWVRTTGTRECKWTMHIGRNSTIWGIYVNSKHNFSTYRKMGFDACLLNLDFDTKDLAKQNTFIGSYLPVTTIVIRVVWRID